MSVYGQLTSPLVYPRSILISCRLRKLDTPYSAAYLPDSHNMLVGDEVFANSRGTPGRTTALNKGNFATNDHYPTTTT